MKKLNRYARHDLNAVVHKAQNTGRKVYVVATAYGFTIQPSKPFLTQSYYEVSGSIVTLVEPKFG